MDESSSSQTPPGPAPRVRLDKWLWAARFYKTRSLATTAVNGGKIHINDERVKPSRQVQLGDRLQIRRGPYEYLIVVTALSDRRGPAGAAASLYRETPESVARRAALAEKRRLLAAATPFGDRRPNKKDRRHIIRFRRQHDIND